MSPRRASGQAAPDGAASVTGADLVAFFRELAADGKMNASTAALHRTAVRKMLETLPRWRDVQVTDLDSDELFRMLVERHGSELKSGTLETYRNTFLRALEMYLTWGPVPRMERPDCVVSRRRGKPRQPLARGVRSRGSFDANGGSFEHLLPLPNGRLAQLMLPADLTLTDARRLAAFVETLATDFEPAGDARRRAD